MLRTAAIATDEYWVDPDKLELTDSGSPAGRRLLADGNLRTTRAAPLPRKPPPEELVHAGLPAGAARAQPGDHVGIEPQRDLLLRRGRSRPAAAAAQACCGELRVDLVRRPHPGERRAGHGPGVGIGFGGRHHRGIRRRVRRLDAGTPWRGPRRGAGRVRPARLWSGQA